MPTLYDYIASLRVDGQPLVWSFKPLSKSQIDSSAGRPYVRVEEMGETPVESMYGYVDVIESTIDVMIYQAADSNGTTPDRSKAMALYFDLQRAPSIVTSWVYGQQLIVMHRDISMPPNYDEDSNGLSGMIRFRLLFPRE